MADTVAHETENTENQLNDANCGDTGDDVVKKPEAAEPSADETGDTADGKGKEHAEVAHEECRKRKSECGLPEDGSDEPKKAKTDDDSSEAQTNGDDDDDQPEHTTKSVEDVKRLAEGEEAAA